MKRRNFLKTCAVGVAAGPISIVMSGEATGKTMFDPFSEYLTIPWKQLVDESDDLIAANPTGFGRYTMRAEAMQRVMVAHQTNARNSGRMLRVTVPSEYCDDHSEYPRVRQLPMAVSFVADRIDVIHDSGYIQTIKNRQGPVEYGIGGRVV